MPDILKLKDGSIVTPFDRDDLLELIQDKLGDDMRRAIESEFADDAATLDEIQSVAEDYLRSENTTARVIAQEILDTLGIDI